MPSRLIKDLIDSESWLSLSTDVKGAAYESLLERNAQDVKTGAGQYFTPRPLIQGMVDVMRPEPDTTICDPACGTGGFLLAAHDYAVRHHPSMDQGQLAHLRDRSLHGWEIVDSAARLGVMNLYLHGIGGDEGAAGETVRRHLLDECDVHTLLRLPTGVFYAQGVKANMLFFDRKPASETPWTRDLWIYDLRTNRRFTLKTNPLTRADLDDFVACYKPKDRHERQETDCFRRFSYEDLVKRDKANLDIFWLRDESMEDSANLPPPDQIAALPWSS